MSEAALDLLKRRWASADSALPLFERLLHAWREGHTGVELAESECVLLKDNPAVALALDYDSPRPLVLQGKLLQSWRHASAEKELAEGLLHLARNHGQGIPASSVPAATRKALAELYPRPEDPQAQAVRLGLEHRLVLVSGGPGTGKTHTAARLLALLLQEHPSLRYGLAAPTGKAAQRLGESVAKASADPLVRAALPQAASQLAAAPSHASTLHRLLEWRPGEDACGRNQDRPLGLDLLIVDEAGMLDLLLWRALLRALDPHCRLVVMGDPLQLESIEPGKVLGALVEAAGEGGRLKGCLARLSRSYRFEAYPGIGALAESVRERDSARLLKAAPLAAGPEDQAQRLEAGPQGLDQALERVWPEILALAKAEDPEAGLKALESLRILCVLNEGPWGVQGLNQRVTQRLAREGLTRPARPVLVTVNDPHSGLFNGDLGVVLPGPEGEQAFFPGAGGVRSFPSSKLPQSQMAWAITVHRSQGSEYLSVVLVLPPEPHALVGPELLYTAVTRARRKVLLVASEEALVAGCKSQAARLGGLDQWLKEG